MRTPEKKSEIQYLDVDEDYSVLGLIGFVFDKTRNRTELVWYNLAPGRLIHPEIINGDDETEVKFEPNWDFFGFDIDELYSRENCPLVKVSLAPKQDFLYPNFKMASRKNVLTAPMFTELHDQWQALEVFTRKVAQVLNKLFITAGIYSDIQVLHPTTKEPVTLLLNPGNEEYPSPIPRYFFRAITYKFEFENQQYNYGIMFVMHNHKAKEEKICPEDEAEIAETGWMKFLAADQLKGPMYACLYNKKNMKFFEREIELEFKTLNLNDMVTLAVNPETKVEYLRNVNVIEEMKMWAEARKKAKEQSYEIIVHT
ncbi:uncharacterized protein LOC135847694 [Planococcus citri]|uniref:uncharacterized protein LOC135847694 n=1 Tax=Planococcus citri TaxID=170843 RepID=UPI0031FA084D